MRYNDKMNITYIAAWNIRTAPLPRKLAPGSAIITVCEICMCLARASGETNVVTMKLKTKTYFLLFQISLWKQVGKQIGEVCDHTLPVDSALLS
jgi:hypothetical protein